MKFEGKKYLDFEKSFSHLCVEFLQGRMSKIFNKLHSEFGIDLLFLFLFLSSTPFTSINILQKMLMDNRLNILFNI